MWQSALSLTAKANLSVPLASQQAKFRSYAKGLPKGSLYISGDAG